MNDFKFAIQLSLALFVVGAIFLVLFAFNLSPFVVIIGYILAVMSLLGTILFLVIFIVRGATRKSDKTTRIKSILMMLLNIPMILGYVYLAGTLMTITRITFENATGSDLTSVRIYGCEENEITSLDKGETETVWFHSPYSCQVAIEYEIDGVAKKEIVTDFLTHKDIVTGKYKIGSNKRI